MISSETSHRKQTPRKRQPSKLSSPGKWLMTALSFTVFVGGWNLIARQEGLAQANTEEPATPMTLTQPQPVTWQKPVVPSWPTIAPLAELAAIPTLVPLSLERFNVASQKQSGNTLTETEGVPLAAIALPTLAPVPTLEPLPVVPPAPPAPAPQAATGTAADFSLYGPPGNYSNGFTAFEWDWRGPLPSGHGFEVIVWRPGGPLLGAHDAVADNLSGRVVSFGNGHYGIQLDIRYAAGVQNQTGDYLWSVALVQVSPTYKNSGIVAQPAPLYFEAGGGQASNGGNRGGNNQTKGS